MVIDYHKKSDSAATGQPQGNNGAFVDLGTSSKAGYRYLTYST